MYNEVTLIGRVGKDAEVRNLENGTSVISFSLATSERYQKNNEWQEITQWHNIVAWRELAERRADLQKGERVLVVGKVTYRQWEKDGVKHYATDIVADKITRLDKKPEGTEQQPQQEPTAAPAPIGDDLPF
jgi:single-strand DNA-binding protein